MKSKGFIFDLNGTMIDDMDYHIRAWFNLFNEFNVSIDMDRMKREAYGKNEEVVERVAPGRFTDDQVAILAARKETAYREAYGPHLQLIGGLETFLQQYNAAGIKMAIGTAAIRENVHFALAGAGIDKMFDSIISADDVQQSKPDPETFLLCAKELNLAPHDCLVFEDSPKGVETAANAGMPCIVLLTTEDRPAFDRYKNITRFIRSYHELLDDPTGL